MIYVILTSIWSCAAAAFCVGRRDAFWAFVLIFAGVFLTKLLPGAQEGIYGFAIWTVIASLLLVRFPVAALLFFASALCYTADSFVSLTYITQVVANVLGFAGLVGVWFGRHDAGRRDNRHSLGGDIRALDTRHSSGVALDAGEVQTTGVGS